MQKDINLPESTKALQNVNTKTAISIILGLSLAATLFLVWLIYLKPPAASELAWVKNLGALNATFNGISTILLLLGFSAIRKRDFALHMKFMLGAFVSSALFLVSYIVYHHFVGDTKFMGEGVIRYIYFFILITHIVLSVFVVPLVLSSFYFAFAGKYTTHRKVTKWTFPIWLYVSITGVLVYAILKLFG